MPLTTIGFRGVGAQAGSRGSDECWREKRAEPAHEFFEIGIDDGPENVPSSPIPAARRPKGFQRVAIVRKGELQPACSSRERMPPGSVICFQASRERRLRLLRRGQFPVRAVARPGGRTPTSAHAKMHDPPSYHITVQAPDPPRVAASASSKFVGT